MPNCLYCKRQMADDGYCSLSCAGHGRNDTPDEKPFAHYRKKDETIATGFNEIIPEENGEKNGEKNG